MAIQLNLEKSKEALVLNLQKRGIATPPSVQVAINDDVSGSFRDEHNDGYVQDIMTRLIPWVATFDVNGAADFFTFSDGAAHAHHVGEITTGNYHNFVAERVIRQVPGYGCGTDYSYVLEKNLRQFGWLPQEGAAPKKSLFRDLFGAKKAEAAPAVAKQKSLVIHLTDGDCNREDKARTHRVLKDAEGRGDEVYFLFLAYSNGGQAGDFRFLKDLGDEFNNTGLVIIPNIPAFTALSDDDLNNQLIGAELVTWLQK